MTKHNTKKLLNLTAVATLTATAGVAVANNTAHADTVNSDAPQAEKQQTPQEQYQAAQKSADQKINDQANANKTKEDALAKQNDAANEADAQKTNDAVNKIQNQINNENADLKKQNDKDYAAKVQEVNKKAAADTKAENDQYNANVEKQTKENQQAEQAQEQSNAKTLADAEKNTTTPAQKQTLMDNAKTKKNSELNKAKDVKDKATDEAKKTLERAQANAQTDHDQAVANQKATNQSRLDEAKKAYQEAVKNAPITGVVKPAEPQIGHNNDYKGNDIYPNTDPNRHDGYLLNENNDPNDANTVHGMNQLDMSGKPGWIYYDSITDDSENINIHNLTNRQKEILNQYTAIELNALRNWFVNNISKEKSIIYADEINNNITMVQKGNVNPLHATNSMIKFCDEINHQRTVENDDDTTHTNVDENLWGENLAQNFRAPVTLLQALIEIHNCIQWWAYGELHTDEFTSGQITFQNDRHEGHLANILCSNFTQVGVIFDHNNAMLLEFLGGQPSDKDITTPEISQILAAQAGKGTPDLNAPSVKAAKKHVEDIKAQNAKDLAKVENESLADAGKDAYNAAIKQANDTYDNTVKQINTAYDAEIKRISSLSENNDKLKASLDQKLSDLKKADAAKLDTLKKAHEDKLAQIKSDAEKELADYKQELQAKLNSSDPAKTQQIADLKAKHEAFVQANAKKLADLQASDTASLNVLKAKLNADLSALHEKLFSSTVIDNHENGHQETKNATNGSGTEIHFANGQTVVLPSNTSDSGSTARVVDKVVSSTANINQSDNSVNTNHNNNSLPQTGTKEAFAVSLLGIVAAMLGLGLAKKRKF